MNRRLARRNRTRGAVALEAALILPFFLLVILGILEFGRAVMIQQIATNACREAARRAVVPGATTADAMTICDNYLNTSGISTTGRVIEVRDGGGNATDVGKIGSHQNVTIVIELPFDQNTWGLTSWLVGKTLHSEVTMRRE